ncbi:DUF805 domain-containing protein [Pelagibaculum spongiae]|uniref:DUF805 domain-containing protein n=1 Tax=Pelagibaculum spongiae TaxID=2080658 RepID=UPI001F4D76CB|nr:DUF805 domain-containing protein [Pelagibaculum spongiae]
MFMLFYLIFYVACIVLDVMVETGGIIAMVYALVMLVPSVSLAARRLHDMSRSGWWQLLVLIPLIGPIVLIVFLVQDSHDANGFGVNPKLAAQ